MRVGTLLRRDARDLIAAAEVKCDDVREAQDEREAGRRHFLPHDGVAARADVRVDADDLELILRRDRLSLVGPFMPDAERGIWATDVRLSRTT